MESRVPHELLTIELSGVGDSAAILRLRGEVDLSSADQLAEQFALAAESEYSELVIDATEVTFMDSSGVHALVEGERLISQNGNKIAFVPSDQVRRVMELVFSNPLFAARVETIDEALGVLGLGESASKAGIES